VVRGPDGKPIANALVLARDEQPEIQRPTATVRTAENGQFKMTLPPGLAFLVRVEADGLAPATVRHARPGTPLAVTLSRGVSIEGTVRDSAGGMLVADATIEARSEMRSPGATPDDPDLGVVRTTSDAKGRFRLAGLAPGLYSLSAFARGFGRAERRNLATGRPVELSLVPGGTVSGAVTDPKNKPVEGATVRAFSTVPSGRSSLLMARTDAQGAYAFHGVTPGSYRAVVTHPEFAPGIAEAVSVERDAETRADFALSPAAYVRGRLVGPGEKPTRGWVAWRQSAGEPVPDVLGEINAEAGDDGAFRLRVGPGSQGLEAGAPGLAARRLDVDVPAASETIDLGDVALEVGIAIRGRVRDAAGRAIERASVYTWSQETDQSFNAQTEADGSYVLAGLTPGLYSLIATATGMGRAERKAEAGANGVDFVLPRGGTISGVVIDDAGKPVDAFRVYARLPVRMGSMSGARGDTFGAPDGRFVLEGVAEGEYVVDVSAPDRATTTVSGVKVAAGGNADIGTVRLGVGGTLKGTVVDASSAPVSGASVRVSGAGRDYASTMPEVTTDAGGAFEIRGLAPGPTLVRVIHAAYAPGMSTGVEVDPAKGPAEVRVVLTQGGRVEGRVRARGGALPAGAVVTARSRGGSSFGGIGPSLQPLAPDGSFVIEHVPTGQVTVTLLVGQAGRYQGGRDVQAQVREGETTTVEISLRNIAVSGKVTRAGAPLVGARIQFQAGGMQMYLGAVGNASAALPPNVAITREDGSYDLVASDSGETYVDIQSADRHTHMPTPTLTLPDADTYVADFNFSGAFIEGVVVDRETEQPLAGAWLDAQAADPRRKAAGTGSAQSGGDGRFRIELDPGEYHVNARAEGYGGESLDLSVGESGTTGVRVALSKGLSIRGRVVDSAGRGVGGLGIAGRTGEGAALTGFYGWSRTQSDGTFEVAGLREGALYTVSTQAEGGLFAVATRVTPSDRPITLVLRPGGRVQVRVLDANGAPAASRNVSVTGVQGANAPNGLGYGQTDASGIAELTVPAGTLELTSRGGGLEGKTTVTVASGGTAAAEMTLRPATP
jgi:protocatechuate 3,4-dioxygenase beta subunit